MLAPIIDQRITTLEVKATAEEQWVNRIHNELRGSVFSSGCSNWYINDNGRNSASWPGYASTYWKETLIPRRGVFLRDHKSRMWLLNTIFRWLRTTSLTTYTSLGALTAVSFYGKAILSWMS